MNIATALMKSAWVSTISYRRILYCHPRPPCTIRLPPIDALAQHRKLGARQRHRPAGCLRPHELAAVKALLEKTNSALRDASNSSRTVDCTSFCVTQKLAANNKAKGTKHNKKARVRNRILTCSRQRSLRVLSFVGSLGAFAEGIKPAG